MLIPIDRQIVDKSTENNFLISSTRSQSFLNSSLCLEKRIST